MLSSWLSSKSSRHRNPSPARDNAQPGPSNASLVSQFTVGPVQSPGNLTSVSDVPLEDAHAQINDTSVYAPTPSLIHGAEREVATLRTSGAPTSSLDATTYKPGRGSARIPQIYPLERPEGALFTPQDAIVAQVFGKSAPPATHSTHTTPPPGSNAPQPSVSLMTSDSLHSPPSIPASRARSVGPTLTIYDPFSGAKLGEQTPVSSSTATPGEQSTSASLPTVDDRKLWSSLERILELQAEIAAMHADMEGVGGRGPGNIIHTGTISPSVGAGEGSNVGLRKGSKRGHTLPIGDEEVEEHEPEVGVAGGAISEISTDHSGGEDEEGEDGTHGHDKRKRDEEFARLAEQFAQRKAAIGGIMNKLDALSTALKTFHTLPPPLFDLAVSPSRTDTISSAPSNTTPVSSPLHVRPDRPLSLSSITTSQAGNPATPLIVPLSPPVLPKSTLAHPTTSGDQSASPVLTPIMTPASSQMVLPTIVPGAPHVESPADMDHVRSIFQRVP